MSTAPTPRSICAALEGIAHAEAEWLIKSDGTRVNLADVLCEIAGGADQKHVTHIPGYCDPETGEPVLLVLSTICAADGSQTTSTEMIPMATLTPAVADNSRNTPLAAQVTSFKLRDAFDGTAGDVLALAIAAASPVFNDDAETAATAEQLCDFDYTALPCGAKCLPDGETDPANAVEVEVDATFVNGVQVRSGGDPEKGGTDLSAPVSQAAGAVSVWCFTFAAEADKAGVIVSNGGA